MGRHYKFTEWNVRRTSEEEHGTNGWSSTSAQRALWSAAVVGRPQSWSGIDFYRLFVFLISRSYEGTLKRVVISLDLWIDLDRRGTKKCAITHQFRQFFLGKEEGRQGEERRSWSTSFILITLSIFIDYLTKQYFPNKAVWFSVSETNIGNRFERRGYWSFANSLKFQSELWILWIVDTRFASNLLINPGYSSITYSGCPLPKAPALTNWNMRLLIA